MSARKVMDGGDLLIDLESGAVAGDGVKRGTSTGLVVAVVGVEDDKVEKEKKKQKRPKKPPKPPRSPTPLDAADEKLLSELAEIAASRKARLERMRALKNMKNGRSPSSTSSAAGNLCALVFTILFCLIILLQGLASVQFHNNGSQAGAAASASPATGTAAFR